MATWDIATGAARAQTRCEVATLTSTARCKRVLGIPAGVTMHDALLDDLIDVGEEAVINYCGMAALTSTTVTEIYDIEAAGTSELRLRAFPVISVAAVVAAGSTLGVDQWYVDKRPGIVRLAPSGYYFPEGRQRVSVTYTFGYATPPADLQHAATLITVAEFNRARHAGLRNEGATGYRYSVDTSGLPAAALTILARYIRVMPTDATA